jgi:diacylglycerol kinase family enzyme/membrane-associated phospholipid phosphatase
MRAAGAAHEREEMTRTAVWIAGGFVAFVAIAWGAGELWTSVVGSLEQEAMTSFAQERTDVLITVARAVTWAGSSFVLVPLAVACCLLLARAGMRREALAVALSLGGATLISYLVKLLTSRPRPPVEHLQLVTGSSFPSSHTMQASAFWLSLALALRATSLSRGLVWLAGAGAVLIALVVAWSRVYLGVHYPTDVIAGLVLGGGWAVFVAHVMRGRSRAYSNNHERMTPEPTPPFWRRTAAVVALLSPLASAAVAAVALAGDVGIAVLAVCLLLGASAAIWVALTGRGARRAAGAAFATLAVAGLIAVLATHWQGVLVLLALLALLALFGVAARYALGRSEGPAALAATSGVMPVGAAEPAVLIINLKSGGGKAERFDLAGEARRRGIEPVVLAPGDDLLELAESAVARGAQAIGMAGGDGSQALVATIAARHDVAHVCIPSGTRNHFALDLGLDRDDVVGALDAFTDGVERRIDLAEVNDRVFVNNASLGVYAKVVQSAAYRDAKLETWTQMLPDLLGPRAEPLDLEFSAPDGTTFGDAPLILVSNNPYRLTHMAGAGTRPRLDTGMLGIAVARVRTPADVSKLLALQLAGQPERFSGLLTWSTSEFEVHSTGPVEVGLDGEALVLDPPLRFRSLPGALRVRLPRGVGLAPGARAVALTADNLGALVRVATGR